MDRALTKKVKVLRNFLIGNDIQEKGKIISVPARLAGELISMNKAEEVSEASMAVPTGEKTRKGGQGHDAT